MGVVGVEVAVRVGCVSRGVEVFFSLSSMVVMSKSPGGRGAKWGDQRCGGKYMSSFQAWRCVEGAHNF